jgi:hypothetical protein
MKTTSFQARLRILRLFTLFIALSFNFVKLSAQITVSTIVPTGQSEALNVGVGTATFAVEITNSSNSTVHISSIVVTQPTGVSLVSATSSIGTASVSGNSIVLNIDLPAFQNINIQYLKKASCSAVPNVTSSFSVQVSDNISVITSSGTKNVTTNSYPILFPGLQVKTPSSLNNGNVKTIQWRRQFTDNIPVKNASSAGKANNMLFCINWSAIPGALQINNMQLQKAGGTIVTAPTITTQGDSAIIKIDSTLLTQMGFIGGIIQPADSFKVILTATSSIYFAKLETVYSTYYLANETNCQLLNNATGIMDYIQPFPNPNFETNKTNVILANWCSRNFEADYVIRNDADTIPSNNLLNSYISFNANECTIVSVKMGNKYLTSDSKGRWYIPALNLDGDAITSDIAPSSLYDTIHVAISSNVKAFPRLGVSIHGNRVDGEEIGVFYDFVGNFQINSQSNVTGPTDANEGDPITYTFNYKAESSNFSNNLVYDFIEVSQAKVICDASGESKNEIVSDAINGSKQFNVIASCSKQQTFRLVLESDNCPSIESTITSASGNTVVQCKGMGGDCYGIYTNTVSSANANTSVNTCQQIQITATGHVDHWCRNKKIGKTCPNFKNIIARVYDNSGALTFTAGSGSVSLNNVANSMTVQNSYAVSKGVAWLSDGFGNFTCNDSLLNTDSFVFNGTFMVNGNHSLSDITSANIRVEFALIDSANMLNEGGWSKGMSLTVYDPEPSFYDPYSFNSCSGITVVGRMKEGAPGQTTKSCTVTSISYPALKGFFYTNNQPYTTNVPSIGTTPVQVPPGSTVEIPKFVNARKIADGDIINIDPLQLYYTDKYASCNETAIYNQPISIYGGEVQVSAPTIEFLPAKLQQTISNTATWTMQVYNSGSLDAANVKVKFQVDDPKNKIDMTIIAINGKPISTNKIQYIDLGAIASKQSKEMSVTAFYKNCINSTDTNHILVTGAWSCNPITASVMDSFVCKGSSTVLQLENMAAVLNAVEQYPAKATLCNDSVRVNINNIGRADLDSLGFWFDLLPANTSLTGNKVNWSFNNKQDILVQGGGSISNPIDLFKKSNHILSDNILGTSTLLKSSDPSIQLGFNVEMHCNGKPEIPLDTIQFHTRGITNCGDEQKKDFIYIPNLKGFEYLKDLVVTSSGGNFGVNKGTSSITAQVKNTSNTFVDSAYITIKLPSGVTYNNSYTHSAGTFVTDVKTKQNTDGSTTVEFELTKGKNIAAGDSVNVTILVTDQSSCPPDTSYANIMGTLKRLMADCENKTCYVDASTQPSVLQLTRPQSPFSPIINGTNTVCIGTPAMYTITGTDIGSVTWSVSPSTENISGNGSTASATFNNSGIVTVNAEVTAKSCSNNKVKLSYTTIVNKAVVTIDPTETSFCLGGSATLSASGATSYVWNDGTLGATKTVSPIVNTSYSVVGTDGNGCKAQASSKVTVNLPPTIQISATETTICSGQSTTISATGADSYEWNNGVSSSSQTVSPNITTTYTVTGSSFGCKAVKTITITVDEIPTISIVATETSICLGKSTTLTASGANDYTWSTGNLGSIQNVTPNSTTMYSVTGTNGSNCKSVATIEITVIKVPTISITAPDTILYSNWKKDGISLIIADPSNGTWTKEPSSPTDNKCGTYTYTYKVHSTCGDVSKTISFFVKNCCDPNFDLVVTPKQQGITTYDVEALKYFIAHPEAFKKQINGTYTLEIKGACDNPIWTVDECFPNWADFNNDGKVDALDLQILIDQVGNQ